MHASPDLSKGRRSEFLFLSGPRTAANCVAPLQAGGFINDRQ
jgi:hypothetical protein